jgi:pheromone shutdown-related protein TraB
MAHIILLGTSHIAEQSIKQLKKAVKEQDPDIIAVELDKQRLQALMTNQKPNYSPSMIRHIGLKGYLFALIGGFFQRKMGRMVGIQPGADMKTAAMLAQQHKKQLFLIDRDITVTLRRLSKTITRKEKWRFITDILFGKFKKQPKIKIDLKNIPESQLIITLLEQLKERYPSFYNVLVEERNHYMARQLIAAAQHNQGKTILAVVGAGHVKGMQEIFSTAAKHS